MDYFKHIGKNKSDLGCFMISGGCKALTEGNEVMARSVTYSKKLKQAVVYFTQGNYHVTLSEYMEYNKFDAFHMQECDLELLGVL